MVNLKNVKHEVISGETRIENYLRDAHKKFVDNFPGRVAECGTSFADGDRLVVHKQSRHGGVIKGEEFEQGTVAKLAKLVGIKEFPDMHKRVKRYWASDERVDRHGDILEQSWRLKEYADNPILLYGHEWSMPPIGSALEWGVKLRDEPGYKGKALQLTTLFARKEDWEFADTIYRLVDGGYLRTGSVGGYPEEVVVVKDDKERTKLGLGPFGVILRNTNLIEYSCVSVPANPGAHTILNSMKSAGTLKAGDIQVLRELKRLESVAMDDERGFRKFDTTIRAAWKTLFGIAPPETDLDESVLLQEFEAAEGRRKKRKAVSLGEDLEELARNKAKKPVSGPKEPSEGDEEDEGAEEDENGSEGQETPEPDEEEESDGEEDSEEEGEEAEDEETGEDESESPSPDERGLVEAVDELRAELRTLKDERNDTNALLEDIRGLLEARPKGGARNKTNGDDRLSVLSAELTK